MKREQFASIIVGAFLGASVMLVAQGREFDKLYYNLKMLNIAYHESLQENFQLSLQLHQSEPLIKTISVDVRAPNTVVEYESIRFIKLTMSYLIGRPVTAVTNQPNDVVRVLHGRTFSVDGQSYVIRINTIVLSENVLINATIAKVQSTP